MHGNTKHGMFGTAIYRAWAHMLQRCTNPKDKAWGRYGGRGIQVCDAWRDFSTYKTYIDSLGPRPSPSHSLDRKDNHGNYEPGNVRWASKLVQSKNRESARIIEFEGKAQNLTDWAKERGIPKQTLHNRIVVFNWPVGRALGFWPKKNY